MRIAIFILKVVYIRLSKTEKKREREMNNSVVIVGMRWGGGERGIEEINDDEKIKQLKSYKSDSVVII